jgi:hypothetical protein
VLLAPGLAVVVSLVHQSGADGTEQAAACGWVEATAAGTRRHTFRLDGVPGYAELREDPWTLPLADEWSTAELTRLAAAISSLEGGVLRLYAARWRAGALTARQFLGRLVLDGDGLRQEPGDPD